MSTPENNEYPLDGHRAASMIEFFYNDQSEVGDIDASEREFCLGLLQEAGYLCIAGSAGSNSATVKDMDRDARADCIAVSRAADPDTFITGPHPVLETGVGIWAQAA